jgi:hypothetical protein
MDQNQIILICTQAVTFILFVVSEVLGNSSSDYNSIYQVVKTLADFVFVKPIGKSNNK